MKYLFSFLIFAVFSCSSDLDSLEDMSEHEVFGDWTDTVYIQPKGLRVEKLMIRSNSSFKYSIEGFGVYENQNLDDKSFSHEDFGNFVLSTRNIYFVSNRHQYWDFVSKKTPEILIEDKVLFESCTYSIENDTLLLKFKSNELNTAKDESIKFTRL